MERFWQKAQPDPNSGCWLWTSSVDKKGYGRFFFNRPARLAHRVAWTLSFGDPGKKLVCHKCDTPCCVNPDHLFLGDAADNTADMMRKRRHNPAVGTRSGRAKLTDEDVLAIRASGLSGGEIVSLYGVSKGTASCVARGASWSHLDGPRRLLRKPPRSGVPGVFVTGKTSKPWIARPNLGGVVRSLGNYATVEEAAAVVSKARADFANGACFRPARTAR